MPAPTKTYDPALPTDKDWVRFLAGDRDVSKAQLYDQEIDALIAAEASNGKSGGQSSAVYLAAARALEGLAVSWQTAGKGIVEKRVDDLQIKRAENESAAEAIQNRINELRAKGAWLLTPRPRALRAL